MLFRFDDFEMDTDAFELRRDGVRVAIQRRVFDLVAYLVAHVDRVVTKEELFAEVWGGVSVSDASLSQAVKQARRALDDDAEAPRFILTTRGRGYRFGRPVERVEADAPSTTTTLPAVDPSFLAEPPASRRRAPLVGRAAPLGQLEGALASAAAGRARLVFVSGEPGVGKTCLLDALAERGFAAGFQVLFGRCYGGDEAPSFWPWREILRGFAESHEQAVLGLVRAGGRGVRSLLPDIVGAQTIDAEPEDKAPRTARFRMFDAITLALQRVSQQTPLLILLDDLQRADEPSLELLAFLMRAAPHARIAVVAAHRTLAPNTSLPLAAALPELGRIETARLIALAGLEEADVSDMLTAGLGSKPTPDLVRALTIATGGNPYFLTQLVRLLAAEGSDPLGTRFELPQRWLRSSFGDAIRGHLSMLSAGCRAALDAAAVLGDSFDLRDLALVSARSTEDTVQGVGEALDLGVVVEGPGAPGRYRFAHAVLRDAIYAALPLHLRITLHGRAAKALAATQGRPTDPRFSEISWHYLQAAPGVDPSLAVDFATRAAEHAAKMGMYEDATRLYERALEALSLGGAEPVRRVEVMLALGNAAFRAGDLARSKGIFEESAVLARQLGDPAKLADAALGYALEDERSATDQRRVAMLLEGLAAVSGEDERRRVLLMGRLAVAQSLGSEPSAREEPAREAVALARQAGDPKTLAYALRCLHFVLLGPSRAEERGAVATEQIELSRRIGDAEAELRGVVCRLVDRLELGDTPGAFADVDDHARLAALLKQPSHLHAAALYSAMRALFEGDLARAEGALEAAGGDASLASAGLLPLIQLRKEQDRLTEIEPLLAASVARAPTRALRRAQLAYVAIRRGATEEASRILAHIEAETLVRDPDVVAASAQLAVCAFLTGDRAQAEGLKELLLPHATRHVVHGQGVVYAGPVSYYLGLLDATTGTFDDAQSHLTRALATSQRSGSIPFEMRALYALSEVLRRRAKPGDAARARSHAAEATALARSNGLQAAEPLRGAYLLW